MSKRSASGLIGGLTDREWEELDDPAVFKANHQPSAPFIPHAFDTRIEFPIPTIYVSQRAYNDIHVIVDECDIEVGWLGLVDTMGTGDFLITEIFLPKQDCSCVSTKLATSGMMQVAKELMARPKGDRLIEKLRFWGHSHCDMDCGPSSQDDGQMDAFSKNCDFFIRCIANKKAMMKFDVFFYDKKITVIDVPWFVNFDVSSPDRRAWKDQIRRKVSGYSPFVSRKGKYKYKPGLVGPGSAYPGPFPQFDSELFAEERYNHERGP